MQSRREFIRIIPVAVAGATLVAGREALAQARPTDAANPKDFANIGYVEKSAKPDQRCNNCGLYQGKATDAWAPCPLTKNLKVAGPGWCTAWNKKTG